MLGVNAHFEKCQAQPELNYVVSDKVPTLGGTVIDLLVGNKLDYITRIRFFEGVDLNAEMLKHSSSDNQDFVNLMVADGKAEVITIGRQQNTE